MVKLLRVALGQVGLAENGQRMFGAADSQGPMKKEANIHLLPWMAHRG